MAYGQYQPYAYNQPSFGYTGYQNGYSGNAPQYNPPIPTYGQSYQQQPTIPQQQIATSIAFVNGSIEARAYPVAPGNRVYLFDTDGRTYYIKGVDFNGMPLPFKIFDSTEIVEPQLPEQSYANSGQPQVNMADYIRRDEVENMIAAEVEKRISAMNAKTGTKKGGETGA